MPRPGDLLVPGWSRVHQGDGAMVPRGGAPGDVCFSLCPVCSFQVFCHEHTQSLLLAAQEYSPTGRETSLGTTEGRPPSLRPQPGPLVWLWGLGKRTGGAGGQRCSPTFRSPGTFRLSLPREVCEDVPPSPLGSEVSSSGAIPISCVEESTHPIS